MTKSYYENDLVSQDIRLKWNKVETIYNIIPTLLGNLFK
jgi:hypothetical protein